MSLNAAIDQKYVPQVEALTSLLQEFIGRWKSAPTLEQKLLVEAEAVTTFEQLLKLNIELEELIAGQHPDINEINGVYSQYTYLLRSNIVRLKSVAELYLKHFNSQQISLMELIGKLRRIRQKHASYSLWNGDDARYVSSEHFLNYDNLANDFHSHTPCDADTAQGILTLPVRSTTLVPIFSARVGSGSNGQPGNSDLDVTTNNINPSFIHNGEVDNWFEYERLDQGPLTLTLVLEFDKEQIINSMSIEPVNLGNSLTFEIDDIIFSTSEDEGTSIHDMLSGTFENDFFTVKSVGNDNSWNITFLPVRTKTVSIKFRADQSYGIEMASVDSRSVTRQRFAIALKDISIFRKQFEQEGGINSMETPLPGGLYAAIPFADIWPPNPVLFDARLAVSLDGGESWHESPNLDAGVGSTVLMQGNEDNFLWRLKLSRQDESFANLESLIPQETLTPDVKTTLHTVSRFVSPATLSLPEVPLDNEVLAIQPKIARRGDRFGGIRLGEATGTDVSFELPFYQVDSVLLDAIRIFVNGRPYDRQEDNAALGVGEFAFSDDFKEVELPSSVAAGSRVVLVLDEEPLIFEERGDGFYAQFRFLFDPDKDSIDLTYLPRDPANHLFVCPRDRSVIKFPHNNLLDSTFELRSSEGVTYTAVTSREDLLATNDSYLLDAVHGVLRLNAAFGTDVVTAAYQHQTAVEVDQDHFKTVFVDGKPWGVRINKSVFVARTVTERLGDDTLDVVNVVTGIFGARDNILVGTGNARVLSYECLVQGSVVVDDDLLNTEIPPEEVEFLDGRSEFLGLTPQLNEQTVVIEAGGNEWVQFNLAAGALWYKDFGVTFQNSTVFSTLKDTAAGAKSGGVGDYHIADDGTITVNVGLGGTLQSGVQMLYHFRDPEFDPANKFSVDYVNGHLYSKTSMNPDGIITYKAACYKAAYDVAREIDSVTYNQDLNVVSVRTEGLKKINSLVKLIWTEAPETADLDQLKEFFSPILSVLAFRFS